jgi:hypothetical protein
VTRLRRRLPALLLILATGVVGWSVWLAATLSSRHVATHWELTWTGFDGLLAAALVATAVAVACRHRLAGTAATTAAALLVADAWFDVTTASPGGDRLGAILLAACAELPIAALLLWISLRLGEPRA